jgi:hypothetical protein
MARAAAAKKRKAAPKKVKGVKVKVPTRKVSLTRRRGGKVQKNVEVVVQTKLAVPAAPKPAAPPARPIKLEGAPLDVSRRFFELHGLPALAQALPPVAMIDELVPRARAEGFTRVFVFPKVAAQRAHAELMVMQLLRAPSAALEPSQQYGMPWLFDLREIAAGEVRGRPEGAYALAIADGPFPDDTRDRKASQLETRFQALGQSSLTVFEYMVLQRLFAEERQDHRFDQLDEAHGFGSGWQWLLDSKSDRGSLHAMWNAAKRRVEIGTTPPGNFNARRGAHPTLVKAL